MIHRQNTNTHDKNVKNNHTNTTRHTNTTQNNKTHNKSQKVINHHTHSLCFVCVSVFFRVSCFGGERDYSSLLGFGKRSTGVMDITYTAT